MLFKGNAYGKILYLYRRWFKAQFPESPPGDLDNLIFTCSDNKKMGTTELHDFLVKYQEVAEENADDLAKTIIASRLRKGFAICRRDYIYSNDFFQYLLSHENHPLKEEDFHEDAFLKNYFVYTSRHSYLKQKTIQTPLQLTAKVLKRKINNTSCEEQKTITYSSIKAIEKALEDGVRVIELDLHPSSDKSDINVSHPREERHSHSITLKKCLEAISEKAFVTSVFPLMMILVRNDLDSNLEGKLEKRIKKFCENKKCCPLGEALNKELRLLKCNFIILKKQALQSANTNDNADYAIVDFYHKNGDVMIEILTEYRLEEAKGSDYTSITQQNLRAVYPSSNPEDAIFTSNFDPLIGWIHGAQMVTSNIQDFGKHLWVMQGLFRAQGGKKPTGYVKKPYILLNPNQIFDPKAWRPVKEILKVKVCMGTGWHLDFDSEQFDDTSPPDFFAAVEIVGVPADEAREKTVPAMDKWVPLWDQEFTFPLTVPELAMLVVEVREFDPDRTHDFGGQTCLPVCQIRSGFRSVPLYDKKGEPFRSARLLMHFKFE